MATETAWTKELPSRDGWYWFKESGNYDLMRVDDDEVYDFGDKEPTSIVYFANRGTWIGPLSPSDAEQLIQLRKLAVEARDVLALLVPYGKIHTVEGVAYPDGTHSEAVDRGEHVLNQLRAALNPDLQKETQGG